MLTLGYANITQGKVSFTPLCPRNALNLSDLPGASGDDISSGMRRVQVLFQNRFRRCIPVLDQVTSFRLHRNREAASFILFCMDDITLLPSTLQPAGELCRAGLVLGTCRTCLQWQSAKACSLSGLQQMLAMTVSRGMYFRLQHSFTMMLASHPCLHQHCFLWDLTHCSNLFDLCMCQCTSHACLTKLPLIDGVGAPSTCVASAQA